MVAVFLLIYSLFAQQSVEPDAEDEYDAPERIRHAETPELAREALIDSVVLIFKSQVEVAFREQTAGHNALLLFVHLALQMMEEQLLNAFKELRAKRAEVHPCFLQFHVILLKYVVVQSNLQPFDPLS